MFWKSKPKYNLRPPYQLYNIQKQNIRTHHQNRLWYLQEKLPQRQPQRNVIGSFVTTPWRRPSLGRNFQIEKIMTKLVGEKKNWRFEKWNTWMAKTRAPAPGSVRTKLHGVLTHPSIKEFTVLVGVSTYRSWATTQYAKCIFRFSGVFIFFIVISSIYVFVYMMFIIFT